MDFIKIKNFVSENDTVKKYKGKPQKDVPHMKQRTCTQNI